MIMAIARDISELMAGNQWQGREGRTIFFSAGYPDPSLNTGLFERRGTTDFRF
jgi:hypothetical protein